jgi:hypothetical protein
MVNPCNVLFWLKNRHKHTLITPHYQHIKLKNLVASKIHPKEQKQNARKAGTNSRGSSIANVVAFEMQMRQRRVLAAKQSK